MLGVRSREHWNSENIKPVDPVTLGLCSQIELDEVIAKSASKRRKMEAEKAKAAEGAGLQPTEDEKPAIDMNAPAPAPTIDPSAADVFKNFDN